MVYQWKVNKYDIEAQVAGEELERISKERPLTPEAIVEESINHGAPLHPIFEWDNEKAGDKWRRQQARDLLRNIITFVIQHDDKEEPTRAFVNLTTEEDREYVPIKIVVEDENLYQQYILQALADLEAFKHKYQNILELQNSFWILDQFIRDVKVGLTEKE